MHRTKLFIIYLGLLSLLSGSLFSKMSWVGSMGIRFFYKEYSFFKIWWQGALAVFIALLCLYGIHYLLQKKLYSRATLYHITGIVIALAGLYFTYADFRQTLSHRWMGERFHLGAYCFWLGWISICIFFLKGASTISNKKARGVE